MELSPTFKRLAAPGTGRAALRLTEGPNPHYPLYYYVESITADGRYLVHHRAMPIAGADPIPEGQWGAGRVPERIDLMRLDLRTGESKVLASSHAFRGDGSHHEAPDAMWRPWDRNPGRGVLDHRSALHAPRGEVLWFDGPTLHATDVATLEERALFTLPEGRLACGQNCFTPDGRWFVHIHHDAALYEEIYPRPDEWGRRPRSRDTVLAAYDLESGATRDLVRINSPIHHVLPYGADRFVFCHPANENGMLLTDLRGGWYSHLRTRDAAGGEVCHYLATERGLMYEVLGRGAGGSLQGQTEVLGGLYDPTTHRRFEFLLPEAFGYTHTGCDPAGRLWFYESCAPAPWIPTAPDERTHAIVAYKQLPTAGVDGEGIARSGGEAIPLMSSWPTYGEGQRSHHHPRLTPDRRWILFTGGDEESGTDQIFLLDASDLDPTEGAPDWA